MDTVIKNKVRNLIKNPSDDLIVTARAFTSTEHSKLTYTLSLLVSRPQDIDREFRDFKHSLLRSVGLLPESKETVTNFKELVTYCQEIVYPHLLLSPKGLTKNEQGVIEKFSIFSEPFLQEEILENFRGSRENSFWESLKECLTKKLQDTGVFKDFGLQRVLKDPETTNLGIAFNLELLYDDTPPVEQFFFEEKEILLAYPEKLSFCSTIFFIEDGQLKELVSF